MSRPSALLFPRLQRFFSRAIVTGAILGGMALAAWTGVAGTYQVGPGLTGFETRNGQVVERTGYGPHWANPWTTEHHVVTSGDRGSVISRTDAVDSAGAHAGVIFGLSYRITAEDPELYRLENKGMNADLDRTLIASATKHLAEASKAEHRKDGFAELIANVRADVDARVAEKGYKIDITNFSIPRGWEAHPDAHRCGLPGLQKEISDSICAM